MSRSLSGAITAVLKHRGQLDQVRQRPAEPVQLGDVELGALTTGGEQRLLQLRAAGEFPARDSEVNLLAAGGSQRIVLRLQVLVSRRHPPYVIRVVWM